MNINTIIDTLRSWLGPNYELNVGDAKVRIDCDKETGMAFCITVRTKDHVERLMIGRRTLGDREYSQTHTIWKNNQHMQTTEETSPYIEKINTKIEDFRESENS